MDKIKFKGFTLIELLVVISIIGILAGFSIVSFNSAQEKGRDSSRKNDIGQLQKALELVKSDSQGAAYYPQCNGAVTTCALTTITPALTPTYIKTVPEDPAGGDYAYYPLTASCTSTSCDSYKLVACLENKNDPDQDAALDASCTAPDVSYTKENP
jgi:general secretion pathway protein G